MSAFDATWLALREPHDHAARRPELADRFAAALGAAPHLTDLGCGTGSNLRYLAPRIAGPHRWRCVDYDLALLAAARRALHDWARARGWATRHDGEALVLARPAGEVLVRFALCDLAREPPDNTSIAALTGSALLDLTSAAWLDSLADRCREKPLLMALSFDGRLVFEPAMPEDEEICRRFITHQRTDKGFGPALGPDAAAYFAERLAAHGCVVTLERADWQLGASEGGLLRAELEGMIGALREVALDSCLQHWAARRRAQLGRGDLRLTVGHLDLLALPG